MYFCQDCGGANAANAENCRVCGKDLVRDRDGAPCQRCGAATAEAANFCSLCGAQTVQIAAAKSPGKAADTVVGYGHAQNRAADGSDLDLGDGIELPEWLKRAAAEQPFDSSRQMAINANPYGPPGGSTATLDAVVAQNLPSSDQLLASQPPLSIPDEEIDSLISQSAAIASDQTRNSAFAADDVSDTSTFISESDLPEWIRQLAAADEAKKLEEIRKADEKSSSERTADADSRRRKSLPGETAPAGPAASPWLARRDRSDESETVVADSWGTAASAEKRTPAPRVAESEAAVAPAPVAAPVIDPVVAAEASSEASGPNMMRLYLLTAIAVVVILAVAYVLTH